MSDVKKSIEETLIEQKHHERIISRDLSRNKDVLYIIWPNIKDKTTREECVKWLNERYPTAQIHAHQSIELCYKFYEEYDVCDLCCTEEEGWHEVYTHVIEQCNADDDFIKKCQETSYRKFYA